MTDLFRRFQAEEQRKLDERMQQMTAAVALPGATAPVVPAPMPTGPFTAAARPNPRDQQHRPAPTPPRGTAPRPRPDPHQQAPRPAPAPPRPNPRDQAPRPAPGGGDAYRPDPHRQGPRPTPAPPPRAVNEDRARALDAQQRRADAARRDQERMRLQDQVQRTQQQRQLAPPPPDRWASLGEVAARTPQQAAPPALRGIGMAPAARTPAMALTGDTMGGESGGVTVTTTPPPQEPTYGIYDVPGVGRIIAPDTYNLPEGSTRTGDVPTDAIDEAAASPLWYETLDPDGAYAKAPEAVAAEQQASATMAENALAREKAIRRGRAQDEAIADHRAAQQETRNALVQRGKAQDAWVAEQQQEATATARDKAIQRGKEQDAALSPVVTIEGNTYPKGWTPTDVTTDEQFDALPDAPEGYLWIMPGDSDTPELLPEDQQLPAGSYLIKGDGENVTIPEASDPIGWIMDNTPVGEVTGRAGEIWNDAVDEVQSINDFAPTVIGLIAPFIPDAVNKTLDETGASTVIDAILDATPDSVEEAVGWVGGKILEWSGWGQGQVQDFIFETYNEIVTEGEISVGGITVGVPDDFAATLAIFDKATSLQSDDGRTISEVYQQDGSAAALDYVREAGFGNTAVGYLWTLGFQVITDPLTWIGVVGGVAAGSPNRIIRGIGKTFQVVEGVSDFGAGYAFDLGARAGGRLPGVRQVLAPNDETMRAAAQGQMADAAGEIRNAPVSAVPDAGTTITRVDPATTPDETQVTVTPVEPTPQVTVQGQAVQRGQVVPGRAVAAPDTDRGTAPGTRAITNPDTGAVERIETPTGDVRVGQVPTRFHRPLTNLAAFNDAPSVQRLIDEGISDVDRNGRSLWDRWVIRQDTGAGTVPPPAAAILSAEYTADLYGRYLAINPDAILPGWTPSTAGSLGEGWRAMERVIHQPWASTAADRNALYRSGDLRWTLPRGDATLTPPQEMALRNYVRAVDAHEYWNRTRGFTADFAEARNRARAIERYFTDRGRPWIRRPPRGYGGTTAPRPPDPSAWDAGQGAPPGAGTTRGTSGSGLTNAPNARRPDAPSARNPGGTANGYPIVPGTRADGATVVRIDSDTTVSVRPVPVADVPQAARERFPDATGETWHAATIQDAALASPATHHAPTRDDAIDLAVTDAREQGLVSDFTRRPEARRTSEALDSESAAKARSARIRTMPGPDRPRRLDGMTITNERGLPGAPGTTLYRVDTPDGPAMVVREARDRWRVVAGDTVDDAMLADEQLAPTFATPQEAITEAQMRARYGTAEAPREPQVDRFTVEELAALGQPRGFTVIDTTTGEIVGETVPDRAAAMARADALNAGETPTETPRPAPTGPETRRDQVIRRGIVDDAGADALDAFARQRGLASAQVDALYDVLDRLPRMDGQRALDVGDVATRNTRAALVRAEELVRLQQANTGITRSLPGTTGKKRRRLQARIDANRSRMAQIERELGLNNRPRPVGIGPFEGSALSQAVTTTARQRTYARGVRAIRNLVVTDIPPATYPMPRGVRLHEGIVYFEGVPLTDDAVQAFTRYVFDDGDTVLDRMSRKVEDYRANPTMWDGTAPGEILDRVLAEVTRDYDDLLAALFPDPKRRGGILRSFGILTRMWRDALLANWLTGFTRYLGTQYLGNIQLATLAGPDTALDLARRSLTQQPKVRKAIVELYEVTGANPVRVAEDLTDTERFALANGHSRSRAVFDVVTGEQGQRTTELGSWFRRRNMTMPAPLKAVLGDERVYREGLIADTINRDNIYWRSYGMRLSQDQATFLKDARRRLGEAGLDRDATDTAISDFLNGLEHGPQWGWTSGDVRRHFSTYLDETISDRLGRDWQAATNARKSFADKEVGRITFGGTGRTRLDDFLSNFILFHYFQSRQLKFITRQALKHPAILNFYVNSQQTLEDYKNANPDMPAWMKGMVSVGTLLGAEVWLNPTALMQVGSIYGNSMSLFDDPEKTWLTKRFESTVPLVGGTVEDWLFMNPVITNGLNLFGYLGDDRAVDILNTSQWGRGVTLIWNLGTHKGWWGEPGKPVGNPLANLFNSWRAVGSGIGLPGSAEVEFVDAANTEQRKLNALILDVAAQQGLNPADPEDAALIEQAKNDPNSPIFKAAYLRYIQGEAIAFGTRIIPGVASFRPTVRLQDKDGRDLIDNQTGYAETRMRNTTDPEAGALKVQSDLYYDLGNPADPLIDDLYTDLAYGEVTNDVTLAGVTYTAEEINSWDTDTRKKFARSFLADNGFYEDWQAYQDEQAVFLADPDNADFAQYTSWQRASRDYPGGIEQYWEDLAARNPNAKRYLDNLDPTLTPEQRERALTGQKAYGAVRGTSWDYNDPSPIETNDYDPLNLANAPAVPIAREVYVSDYEQSFWDDLDTFEQYASEAQPVMDQIMVEWGWPAGTPLNRVPYGRREDMKDEYYDRTGYGYPEPSGSVRAYAIWASKQAEGTDTSPEAYLAYKDEDYIAKMPQYFNEDMGKGETAVEEVDPLEFIENSRSKDPGYSWEDADWYWTEDDGE